ncbi:MAG: hypothetical protein Pg6A_16090 [Termitinemataceae bacterium]|nr:MAG: hypothetical protein Pg6A_16090 [Termitinemataceae bacterium]
MKQSVYTIKNSIGINPRPAMRFTKLMAGFESHIKIRRGNDFCNGKDLYELLNLQVRVNETITLEITGSDEEAAMNTAEVFLKQNL